MGLIRVTSEELRQQGGNTTSAAANVQDLLTTLQNQITDLSTRWEGAASSSFQSLYADWQNGARTVHQSLEGIAKLLGVAADTYENAEQSIKSSTQH